MDDLDFTAPPVEEIAAHFPGYKFRCLIAQGGMGAVYRARQQSLDRGVAIKILPRELGADSTFRHSFQEEARAMARLSHPNLIAVYDSGTVDGLLYIIMELVYGKSLYHSAHKRQVEPKQAVKIVTGICHGLAHAHASGIVHRDIKPANILLTPEKEPKIGDFGLARLTDSESKGLVMGTPGYTAPEVFAHPEIVDHRADVFAVGIILYELLTGLPPETDNSPPALHLISDHSLRKICQAATRGDLESRTPTIKDLAKALEDWSTGKSTAPRPDPSPTSTGTSTQPATSRKTRRARASRRASSPIHWGLLQKIVIILVLLGAIAFTGKLLQHKRTTRNAPLGTTASPSTGGVLPNAPVSPALPISEEPLVPIRPVSPTPPPAGRSELPMESLLRLRSQLVAGERSEMPLGTITRGEATYFQVRSPMSWNQARRFATAHGGHLPLIESADELSWLTAQFRTQAGTKASDSSSWLGVRFSALGRWQSLSGNWWPLETLPQGQGTVAALRSDDSVVAGDEAEKHSFFIQWQGDGSDPTTLLALLDTTHGTLTSTHPAYPPGTVTDGNIHALVIERSLTAREAAALAKRAGGHLMIPASTAEAGWLQKIVSDHSAPLGYWLGGERQDLEWKWTSEEPWTFAKWAPEAPSGNNIGLVMAPRMGWRDADPESQASGLVIEWSTPDSSPTAPPLANHETITELRTKAATFLAELEQTRQKALVVNAKNFDWNLDLWVRNNAGDELPPWLPGVRRLKAAMKDQRVPTNARKLPPKSYHAGVRKIALECLLKQESIDETFRSGAIRVRNAFVERLQPSHESYTEQGQTDLVRDLTTKIERAADLKAWVADLGFFLLGQEIIPDEFEIEILSAIYGTGGKNANVTARVISYLSTEKKDFRVNPKNLGADPSPGWNKNLKITYKINGITKTRNWGENSLVKTSDFEPE